MRIGLVHSIFGGGSLQCRRTAGRTTGPSYTFSGAVCSPASASLCHLYSSKANLLKLNRFPLRYGLRFQSNRSNLSQERLYASNISSLDSLKLFRGDVGRSKPPGVAGGRRAGIVWFRTDLRMHDNEALHRANAECSSLLPVYCFDPRDYGRSPQGYDKTGPYRANFLIQAVENLRQRLRSAGNDLIVRIGKPEELLPELARKIGASAIYCHSEVTYEELKVENSVRKAAEACGVKIESFWTNTLHHPDNLPFKLSDMPQNFDQFKKSVAAVATRKPLAEPRDLKGSPMGSTNVISCGEIPSLEDLGLRPLASKTEMQGDGKHSKMEFLSAKKENNEPNTLSSCPGGESHALRQLENFITSVALHNGISKNKNYSDKRPGQEKSGYARATSFSSSVAPYLATGCLSPRAMLQESAKKLQELGGEKLEKTRTVASLQWVEFELLWRDFFRLLTRRHSEVVLPATSTAKSPSFVQA